MVTIDGRGLAGAAGTPIDIAGAQATAYTSLLDSDRVLRRIAYVHGRPDPFVWDDGGRTGTSNFAALLLHIAGQQISTAVAFILFDRVRAAVGAIPDPSNIVSLGPERLRSFGLSRAKASYMLSLTQMHLDGALDVDRLDHLDDEQAITALTAVRGIGRWSAEMFLIHQMHRPDVLPAGDLGIRRAVETAWGLPGIPTIEYVRELARDWSPYRSYAAALLWASLPPKGTSRAPTKSKRAQKEWGSAAMKRPSTPASPRHTPDSDIVLPRPGSPNAKERELA